MAPRKTESTLFHQLSSPESLMVAWKKVRANKGRPGVDLITIQQFERDLVTSLEDLSLRLREERYYPMPIRRVQMEKASGGKRELGILTVEDRIVQRAALDTLEPLFEREFLDCSFGFRPNRSVQDAINRVLAYQAQGCTWAVDADIRDFFGALDHPLLMGFLSEKIYDRAVLRLIQMWLDMGIMDPPPTGGLRGAARSALSLLDQTKGYLVGSLDRALDYLIQRGTYSYEGPLCRDLEGDPDLEGEDNLRSLARKEALRRMGRDGILLLLTYARGGSRFFTPQGLAITASSLLAAAALPVAHQVLRERVWRGPRVGTVQGGAISPLLSNVYLHQFDRAMVKQGYFLVRYCDDFLILAPNEARARQALEAAGRRLAELKLSLNQEKTRVVSLAEEIPFLGHSLGRQELGRRPGADPLSLVRWGLDPAAQKGKELWNTGMASLGSLKGFLVPRLPEWMRERLGIDPKGKKEEK